MDLDQITRPLVQAASTPPAYAGKVSRLDDQGNAYATVPALSDEYEHGPLKHGPGAAPSVGSDVLVVFDEDHHPWVASQGATGPAGPTGSTGPTGPAGTPARVLIAEYVVGGTASIMDLSSIPATYADLEVEVLAHSTRAATSTGLRMWLNNDRGSHYHINGRAIQPGPTGTDVANVNDSWGYLGQCPAGGGTTPGSATVRIPGYSRTDTNYKVAHVQALYGILTGATSFHGSFLRFGDTAAISRIGVGDDIGGGCAPGSRMRVYGLA